MTDVHTILEGLTVLLVTIDTAVLVALTRVIVRDAGEVRRARLERARIRSVLTE